MRFKQADSINYHQPVTSMKVAKVRREEAYIVGMPRNTCNGGLMLLPYQLTHPPDHNYNIPSKDMNGPSQWSLRDHISDDNTKLHVHGMHSFWTGVS